MTALRVRGPSLPDSALSASAPGDFRPVFHFFNVGAIARGEPDDALARRSTRDRRARRSRHRRCPFARARTSRKRLTDRASSSSRRRARATDSSATRGFFRRPPSVRGVRVIGLFSVEYETRARRLVLRARKRRVRRVRARARPTRPARAGVASASRVRARVLSQKLRQDRSRVLSCEPHTSKQISTVRHEIRRRLPLGARDDARRGPGGRGIDRAAGGRGRRRAGARARRGTGGDVTWIFRTRGRTRRWGVRRRADDTARVRGDAVWAR